LSENYACVTACAEGGRFSPRLASRTCFGFSQDPTRYGQYVFEEAFRPDLFNLMYVYLVSEDFRRLDNVAAFQRFQYERNPFPQYMGQSGLMLEEWTMTPGHGKKPGELNLRVVSANVFLSDNDSKRLLDEVQKHDWTDRMLVLSFPCEPFPLPQYRQIPHFEERAQLRFIAGSPGVRVIGRK